MNTTTAFPFVICCTNRDDAEHDVPDTWVHFVHFARTEQAAEDFCWNANGDDPRMDYYVLTRADFEAADAQGGIKWPFPVNR